VPYRPGGSRSAAPVHGLPMKELLRTNDIVRLSWLQALLADAGIDCLVLDQHTSLVEGSIGAIQRRLMVDERDHGRAKSLISEADAGA
jgi:Putative prokaryotic signal transducing protein